MASSTRQRQHCMVIGCCGPVHIGSWQGRKEMFYLTTHSTHFIYGYMASDIWLRTILIVRKETCCCRLIGYSFRLTARVLLYAPSHRQDSTYHGLCYTSRGALAGTRNSSMDPPWRIDPTTHRTMSECSHHGATSRSAPDKEQDRNVTWWQCTQQAPTFIKLLLFGMWLLNAYMYVFLTVIFYCIILNISGSNNVIYT